MDVKIETTLIYDFAQATDVLLQVEVADIPEQTLASATLETSRVEHFSRIAAEEGVGTRAWLRANGRLRCDYSVKVTIDRPEIDLRMLAAHPPHDLPGETVRFLMPSRFCQSDMFESLVAAEFAGLSGGARVLAMRDWVQASIAYVPGSSHGETSALDTFVQRQGVCRDFAHVLITLARASDIPARFASVYAPGVTPQDFHAVAEVFLDGNWHLVDATGMARADTIARIGVGPDAANVPFLAAFGRAVLVEQSVAVSAA